MKLFKLITNSNFDFEQTHDTLDDWFSVTGTKIILDNRDGNVVCSIENKIAEITMYDFTQVCKSIILNLCSGIEGIKEIL